MGALGQMRVRVAAPALDKHPSSYVVRDFVRSLVRGGVKPIRLPRWVGSALARSGRPAPGLSRQLVIVPLMGPRVDTLAAASLYGLPIPFCWDVWEPQWEVWAEFLDRFHPPLVVTTALRSAEHLRGTLRSSRVAHLPEAIDIGRYDAGLPLNARSTDLLELGRRNSQWHDLVERAAETYNLKHLYERAPGEFVFADETTLVAGLSDSKISVCFPSNITHPDRSGSVSTVTSRYLESIASRCLLLGEAPGELSDLLGFNPAVTANMEHPWEQLHAILGSIERYQAQVDDAYSRVKLIGGWDCRAQQLMDLIRSM